LAGAWLVAALFLLLPLATFALPISGELPPMRHFLVEAVRPLTTAELAQLAAAGVQIQHVMPGDRYLVRASSAAGIASIPTVRSVEAYGAAQKIAPSAYHEAAAAHAFSRVRLIFHDDVSFEDARAAIEAVGGTIERPLADAFEFPHRLVARIPSFALEELAKDEGVFGIYGPPLHPAEDNSLAASLSNVTPLYSAPYDLTGQGVVVSEFELSAADKTHPEFQGRLTVDDTTFTDTADASHATHVAGTIMAGGVNCDPSQPNSSSCLAKGMAPAATLHEFNANSDTATFMNEKQNSLPALGIVADNNSWGFQLGWQPDGSAPGGWVWYDAIEYFGGYDGFYSAPYDKIARNGPVLFVHSAGNDGTNGTPNLSVANWSEHGHTDDNGNLIKGETFCYSQDGTGTDCPTPFCSTPLITHCENSPTVLKHPTYGPFGTMGVLASAKNVVAVGAVGQTGGIAGFSSRGPTKDGRIKPDLVAMGLQQWSTLPNAGYGTLSGTSMSSPVVTGISALLTEQWRRTFAGQSPTPEEIKTMLIAGADDLGNAGPDYSYGFGLVDARKSADLIVADNGAGARIRHGDLAQGQQVTIPISLAASQNVRVVLGWNDPEVLLGPNDLAGKTLVNDLDLTVAGPGGTVLPYILDPNHPDAAATRGVNSIDNVEEVEIANAPAGNYTITVTGTNIANGPTQHYVVVSNAPLSAGAVCTDSNEPNDTLATATFLPSTTPLLGRFCSQNDIDDFTFSSTVAGTAQVTVTAHSVPVSVGVLINGTQVSTRTVAAGASAAIPVTLIPGENTIFIQLQPAAPVVGDASYTVTAAYPFTSVPRHRSAGR